MLTFLFTCLTLVEGVFTQSKDTNKKQVAPPESKDDQLSTLKYFLGLTWRREECSVSDCDNKVMVLRESATKVICHTCHAGTHGAESYRIAGHKCSEHVVAPINKEDQAPMYKLHTINPVEGLKDNHFYP